MTLDLDPLIPQEPPLPPSFRYATVTATDPLRIRLDGDEAPLPITPQSLIPAVPGERVYVGIVNRRITVLGAVGGPMGMVARGQPSRWPDGSNDVIRVGGETNAAEPSLRLDRLRGSTPHGGILYIPADSETNGSVALLARSGGENVSRLRLRHDGQVIVNTYPTQNRPLPFAIDTGTVTVTGTGSNTATASISFASGRFTKTPRVFATINSSGSNASFGVHVHNISTSGATVRLNRDSDKTFSSAYSVQWLAIQLEA